MVELMGFADGLNEVWQKKKREDDARVVGLSNWQNGIFI